jgi:hypothetical protein
MQRTSSDISHVLKNSKEKILGLGYLLHQDKNLNAKVERLLVVYDPQ